MIKFKLSDKFLTNYEGKQPSWGFGDLSYLVYKRTYSRIMENGQQEEWFDTVKRVVEGCFNIQKDHCEKVGLPWDAYRAQKSAQKMFEKIWEFKFTPPGRGLWICGTSVVEEKGGAALNNCGFFSSEQIGKDFGEPFSWAADMLMLGVGIGYDTRGANKLLIKQPTGKPTTYQIPDTREGWAEAVRLLIDSFDGRSRTPVEFDYTLVRAAGEPIKGFGGTASGPEPLREGLESIRNLLTENDSQYITSVVITDIVNFIGKFVVAGNVRRSATISFSNDTDRDFIEMKDPVKFTKELIDRRWVSNNSVFAGVETDFASLENNINTNGEPGLFFLDNARHYGRFKDGYYPEDHPYFDNCTGSNPCVEQLLEDRELCTLVETYPARHKNAEEYFETLKYAYLYAKSVTLVPTHSKHTNAVMLKNRRIGVSQSGIQQALKKFGHATYFKRFCDEAYGILRNWDKIYSRWLGIPTSIRVSSIKPSGTVSLLTGSTPGVHCTHSEYYFRTVRMAANSSLLPNLVKANYRIEYAVTDTEKIKNCMSPAELDSTSILIADLSKETMDKFKNIGGTVVIYFPIKEENFTKSKYDISIWEQMSLVRELQHNWADNCVSVTVTIKPEEKKDLVDAIRFFAPYIKALSFLPLDNHGYAQAPYTTCSKEEYEQYKASLKPLTFKKSKAEAKGERFCTTDRCEV